MRLSAVLLVAPLAVLPLTAPAAAAPSPSPTVSCPYAEMQVSSDHRVGGVTTVTATRSGGDPDRSRMSLTRLRPTPGAVVRQQSDTGTTVTWTLRLGETHVLQIGVEREDCWPLGRPDQPPLTVPVRAAVSIGAVRHGVRDYTFSGRVVPARGQTVDLHRVESSGRRVLTARGAVREDGTYRIDRRFTGSGRFGFVASVGESSSNAPGSSPVRPTVLH